MTTVAAVSDAPVLMRFRDALVACYGPRPERAVLFGSRARGDFRSDSDYDLAVLLHGFRTFWTELEPLGTITTDILMGAGALISAKPFPAGDYPSQRSLMQEIVRDDVGL